MATVNYRLREVKSDNYPILIYLSLGRNNTIQVKTPFVIDSKNWSTSTKRPKQNNESNKQLFNQLKKLESFVYEELNKCFSNEIVPNRYWLEETVSNCFNLNKSTEGSNENLLSTQIQYIIDNAKTRVISGSNKIGLSENRIKGYKTFLNTINNYENEIRKGITLTNINHSFVESFKNWLLISRGYQINYVGKIIDNLKTVAIDSAKRGIKVNEYVSKIESFRESRKDKLITTLTFDELTKIRYSHISKPHLINTRKWLLLGCEIGQRGGDLVKITENNIRYINNNIVLDLYQEKTRKRVTIPIYDKYIEQILVNELPHKISSQKFNLYLKELCKECGINEIIEGKKFNPNLKRTTIASYPKYELISSHVCRRSFATNYYKHIPTPILMEITGHSKESMFLEYIGKPKDKDENAKLFLNLVREMNIKKEPILKVV